MKTVRLVKKNFQPLQCDIQLPKLFPNFVHNFQRFCANVMSGNGRIFECLLAHRSDQQMKPKVIFLSFILVYSLFYNFCFTKIFQCTEQLAKRAAWIGKNFRLAHPLVDGCDAELRKYNCLPQQQYAASPNFHLTCVLLCLENAQHREDSKFSEQCRHEMLNHRKLMMTEFRLSPEIVMSCAQVSLFFHFLMFRFKRF